MKCQKRPENGSSTEKHDANTNTNKKILETEMIKRTQHFPPSSSQYSVFGDGGCSNAPIWLAARPTTVPTCGTAYVTMPPSARCR